MVLEFNVMGQISFGSQPQTRLSAPGNELSKITDLWIMLPSHFYSSNNRRSRGFL